MNPPSAPGEGNLPFADVRGKVALLTVNSVEEEGINLALELMKRGCRVVLAGNPLTWVTEARDQVCRSAADAECAMPRTEIYNSVKAVELDPRRGEQAVEQAVEEAWCTFGGINILVNSASVLGSMKPVLKMSESDYDKIMTVNVKAAWLVSKAVARKMQKAGSGGSVLFLTSISGTERGIYPGVSIYGTSMAAINHLTKMMAMEIGKYGIRVNAIACGLNKSDVLLKSTILLESKGKESPEKLARSVVPLQRWSQFPNDIIGVVLWLASDSSSFVTGTITIVDGGLSLRRPRMGEYRSQL